MCKVFSNLWGNLKDLCGSPFPIKSFFFLLFVPFLYLFLQAHRSGDLFVLLFSQEQRNNIYRLLHVQGRRWHWIILYFWWTHFLFSINTGGLLLIGQRSGYIGGLFAVGEGDHTCLLRSLFPILLFLPQSGICGFFSPFPFFHGVPMGSQHRTFPFIP